MRRALQLARKGEGRTSPNPMVGAVVVKRGAIVGEGYHKRAGLAHAEIAALRQAGSQAQGADLYVNLEPCCHFGRTPPCTDEVAARGIRHVVVGMRDPNRLVRGKGIRKLREHGIRVTTGVLRRECERLNEVFVKFMKTGTPFVTLKAALTMDGKIATATGESRWITGPKAREKVHQMRDKVDAILVGAGTVLRDNPRLTTRLPRKKGKDPVRVILDDEQCLPLTAKVFKKEEGQRVIYVTGNLLPSSREHKLVRKGIEILKLKTTRGGIDLRQLMARLGAMNLVSVLIEGGSKINASALKAGIIDKVVFFLAPRIIGGQQAPGVFGGQGIRRLSDAYPIKNLTMTQVGEDLMLEGNL